MSLLPLRISDVVRHRITPGRTALVVDQNDASAAFVMPARTLSGPSYAAFMGACARADALDRFGIQRMVDATVGYHEQVMGAAA